MDTRLQNLRDKSIFDFCSDKEWLSGKMLGYASKEDYLAYINADMTAKAFSLIDYAEDFGDTALAEAIEEQFKAELDEFYNEL